MPTPPARPRHPHTAVKHELLVRYLDVWTPTVLRSAKRAAYAEGYAGAGPAAGGGDDAALLALRVFGEFADHMAGRRLTMVLAGADSARLGALTDRLAAARAELGNPPELVVDPVPGSCAQLAPALRASAGAAGPVLAYLDSVGADPPPFAAVAAIAAQPAAELLITLDPDLLAGLAAGQVPAGTGDLLFGDDGWRAAAAEPAGRRYRYLVNRYRAALQGAGLGGVLHVELVADDGTAQLLVFATRTPKHLEQFKDALWAVDEYAGVRYRDPRDGEHALLDISLRPQLAPLRQALLDTVAGQGECTVAELRRHALAETVYRTADANRALSALLTAGTVTRHPGGGRLSADTVIRAAAAAR